MQPTSTNLYRLWDENSKPNYQNIYVEEMKVTVSGQQDGRQGEMGLLYSTSNINTIEFASDNRCN